jgi:ankyrin repeat protein
MLMLKKKADVKAFDINRIMALHQAASSRHTAVVNVLLMYKTDVSTKDKMI